MQMIRLGRTGLEVSRLCLGTMNFGPLTSEPDSFAIMDRALELGINFFDTANVYGFRAGRGLTEQIVGRWLAQGGGRREQIVLATKVFGKMGEAPNEGRLSAYHIRRACEDSLRRLQTDHIDLYQMHHIDRSTPWEEIWQAMEQLIRQGKVIYVGSSNFAAWHITLANAEAGRRNLLGLVSEQSLYNLAVRAIELEVLPACRELGIAVLPWSPLYGGILAGSLAGQGAGGSGRPSSGSGPQPTEGGQPETRPDVRRESEMARKRREALGSKVEVWEGFCRELGDKPADVAMAWVLSRPGVTSPIIGPRTVEQLNDGMRALEISLTEETLARLDEIWPGPGGAAPEAYAW